MLLVIDAGNTNIVFALFEGETPLRVLRCETHPLRTAEGYADWLREQGVEFSGIAGAAIGSVVPAADEALQAFCRGSLKCEPLVATHETVDIKINMKRPEQVGADRLLNGYAAMRDYGAPVVVVDFGTATTFDVVNGRGEFIGGVIAPGPKLSAEALHRAAAKLPRVDIMKPATVIGTDTVSAMQSGLYWGYVALVEGILARLATEMGEKPFVVATGGLSKILAGSIPAIRKTDDDLTLRGLLYLWQNKSMIPGFC